MHQSNTLNSKYEKKNLHRFGSHVVRVDSLKEVHVVSAATMVELPERSVLYFGSQGKVLRVVSYT